MKHLVPAGLAAVCYLAIAPTNSAAAATNQSILGRYQAVTESEWHLELEIRKKGAAIYTLSSWEPGKAAAATSKTEVPARWKLRNGILSIVVTGPTADQSVSYEISSCLSHQSFGGSSCSPGLRPVSNGMGPQYWQPLWNARTFKLP
jgi:hypothetical protein